MRVRQRRKMEQERDTGHGMERQPERTTTLLNPRGGRHAVFAFGSLILVLYLYNLHDPHAWKWRIDEIQRSKIKSIENEGENNRSKITFGRKMQADVMLNLTTRNVHVLHEFCDSFGECFSVEQRYWKADGKIVAHRMIAIRAKSSLVLTMAVMITPKVISPAYLDPLQWAINHTVLSLSLSDLSRPQMMLQIGLGGGVTTNFLALMPMNLSIDVVELEPTVYDVAKQFFDLTNDKRVRVHIEDGVKFTERATDIVYDSILLDACTNDVKETILCPAGVFQSPIIIGKTGVLSVNMFTTRDQGFQQLQIEQMFRKHFVQCFSLRFTMEQKMLFCSNRDDFYWSMKKKEFLENLDDFDYRMRTNLHKLISNFNN
ncbi:hypothetical protein PENTCL1PPCAC_25015 [Pristionchus entomophagus]|uniref:Methyltransferase n=1 Tax=Pristionchus entomophagus TaxID=358040 RepID=A0AAV5U8P8_9BILA|nr:hypothetical protein PENTCL1PPCAC_25015 [Pristionchus entomophagus]